MKCVFDDQTKNISSVLDAVWPVGSIYISVDATNPGEKLGGTWEVFAQGQMLLGFSDTHDIGSTGGEETHTLTKNEMPSHTHSGSRMTGQIYLPGCEFDYSGDAHTPDATGVFSATRFTDNAWSGGHSNNRSGLRLNFSAYPSVSNTGGGAAHNNMPPYITVGIWRRIA